MSLLWVIFIFLSAFFQKMLLQRGIAHAKREGDPHCEDSAQGKVQPDALQRPEAQQAVGDHIHNENMGKVDGKAGTIQQCNALGLVKLLRLEAEHIKEQNSGG